MMNKFRVILLGVMVVSLFWCSEGLAQTVTGTLSGSVADSSGAVMPGIKILVKNEQTGLIRESVTNEFGYYQITFLPVGPYSITVTAAGFKSIEKKGVIIQLNTNTVSNFSMDLSAVSVTVTVEGEAPLIESTTGELKHTLNAKQVEDTPVPGRNIISLVEQIPGFQFAPWTTSSNNPTNSTGSYASFGGTGSRSATFQTDGVNNDDSSENQNRQGVNLSTIREFQVLTNSYSSEFGRAGGAVVLIQTKSGTNQYHGEVYDFIQNDWFNANGFFQNQNKVPRATVRRNQYGWTAGGPVVPTWKDKLFFFTSGERMANNWKSSTTRWIWLPGETPHACAPGEVSKPGGPYCVDPATHPNLQRDLDFMKRVMSLWNTDQLKGATPNDVNACATLISSGRPNRCVTINGVASSYPLSDYTGKLDWNARENTRLAFRYQYSRQVLNSGRIILGDNYGVNNNRQYNLGLTATHVFTPTMTGEFRYGFGNRATLQDVADGNDIPTLRFGSMLGLSGTIIGTSMNVPINRRQRDHQFVYNHSMVGGKHTLRFGIDQRFQALDDVVMNANRGYWNFGSNDSTANIQTLKGYTGFENFLRGIVTTIYQRGYGPTLAENRFGETNLYVQDDYRFRRNFTLNLGLRWEGVRAPSEVENRFSYGYSGSWKNFEPRIGFAWQPEVAEGGLWSKLLGKPGDFVLRGGYGIFHNRIFQSIFSQSGLSLRSQPPIGYSGSWGGLFPNEISDPSNGFVFVPGTANRTSDASGGGVKVKGGMMTGSFLVPDSNLGLPNIQQWNLTMERQLPGRMALEVAYSGNRMIGGLFYDYQNISRFPFTSPLVTVDVGGGNYVPVVFDKVCVDFSDPMCVVKTTAGAVNPTASGASRAFSSLTSTTASLADKGIVIINGVPHGYISLATTRLNERRPDPGFGAVTNLRNFSWSYYNSMIVKVTKRFSSGLTFAAAYTWSKAIDTGSEATYTGVDTNSPTGKGNAAASLRGLSGFDARQRLYVSYSYELPWFKSQQGLLGRIAGGWSVSGTTTFQSGNPFTVVAGYDVNLDGLGSDRPWIADPSYLFRSVDNGRAMSPCPTVVPAGANCPDTLSQLQLPGGVFIPSQASSYAGDQRIFTAGADGTGTIGRNTFFSSGMKNFDAAFSKSVRIRENVRLTVRMEFYNLFNRTMFGVPSRTLQSGTPMGRITSQITPTNFVGAYRDTPGSRMGQLALRLTF